MASDDEIAHEIKAQVAILFQLDSDNVTVSSVRSAVEDKLGLALGFLKSETWKDRSKTLIQQAFTESEEGGPEHLSATNASQRKRKSHSSPEEVAKKSKKSRARVNEHDEAESKPADTKPAGLIPDDELSELEDDGPTKRQRSKSKGDAKPKSKAPSTKSTSKKPAAVDLTPDEQEIKKLQSQLVQCGVRKVWGVELKKFDSSKAKMSHLRGMLQDVGMEGRFSEEKAKRIKEEREFSKDLAEIKEGNKAWGRSAEEDEDEAEGERPRRRLAKGLAELDVFQDDEESE